KNGVATRRVAGKPGCGHVEIAKVTEKLDPKDDVYQQMFALGYARVQETADAVMVDAPRALAKQQKRFLDAQRAAGKCVTINAPEFAASRSRSPSSPARGS